MAIALEDYLKLTGSQWETSVEPFFENKDYTQAVGTFYDGARLLLPVTKLCDSAEIIDNRIKAFEDDGNTPQREWLYYSIHSSDFIAAYNGKIAVFPDFLSHFTQMFPDFFERQEKTSGIYWEGYSVKDYSLVNGVLYLSKATMKDIPSIELQRKSIRTGHLTDAEAKRTKLWQILAENDTDRLTKYVNGAFLHEMKRYGYKPGSEHRLMGLTLPMEDNKNSPQGKIGIYPIMLRNNREGYQIDYCDPTLYLKNGGVHPRNCVVIGKNL